MTETIILRVCDNSNKCRSVDNLKARINGENYEGLEICVQGLSGALVCDGITAITKMEGVKNAYICRYESVLKGLDIKAVANYSKELAPDLYKHKIEYLEGTLKKDNAISVKVYVDSDNNDVVVADMSIILYYA